MSRIETGAAMLGIELHPHQHELGELLDAGEEMTAVQWPRRAGKTTSVWAWMLGRCQDEPETQIVTTAQSGVKARDRFLSMMRVIERRAPESDGGPHIYKGAGHESFDFANGSRLWVVAPKSESVRGDAAHVVYVDEPQELDPDHSLDLQQAVMPLFDTVDGGQIVLSGTPGPVRAGWYWKSLQVGLAERTGCVRGQFAPGHAVSVFAAEPGDDIDDESVWRRVHPGLTCGMTKIETLRARRAAMSPLAFSMEYLGVWPGQDDGRAIPEKLWAAAAGGFAPRPSRFALAFDVSPDSSVASLVAAWRDDDGVGHVELLEQGDPRAVGKEALRVALKHRAQVAYDEIGANLEVADGLSRARPKPKLSPQKMGSVVTAASSMMTALRAGEFRHPDQAALNAAAEGVAWRTIGDSGQLFGRRASAGDVTAIVAASLALLSFDRLPAPQRTKIHTRRTA